jgi:hypothetical protein
MDGVLHPFSIYTTKSSDFSNFCGVIGYNFFGTVNAMSQIIFQVMCILKRL